MLVLSRRLNETIVLPGIDTTFQLLAVRGSVPVGVQAPETGPVFRRELLAASGAWPAWRWRRPAARTPPAPRDFPPPGRRGAD